MLGQGQAKCQSLLFSPYRLPRPDQRHFKRKLCEKLRGDDEDVMKIRD